MAVSLGVVQQLIEASFGPVAPGSPSGELVEHMTETAGVLGLTQGGTGATTAGGARTSLGLGSMAVQNANAVAITGGTISGLSSALAIADGGTGATTAAGARTALGVSLANVLAEGATTGGTSVVVTSGDAINFHDGVSADVGIARDSAGIAKITDGSTGYGSLRVANGSQSTPSLRGADADSGLYFVSSQVSITVDSNVRVLVGVGSTNFYNNIFVSPSGSAAAPAIYLDGGGTDTGLYSKGGDNPAWAVGGQLAWELTNTRNVLAQGDTVLRNDKQRLWSSTTDPSGSPDVGLARSTTNRLRVTDASTGLGGVEMSEVRALDPSLNVYARVSRTSPSGFGVALGQVYGFGSTANAVTGIDTMLVRAALGSVRIRERTNEYGINLRQSSELLSGLTGSSVTTSGLIPAGVWLLGVSVRVTTLITGATSFDIGDGSDVDRFGATIALAADTTADMSDATADPTGWSAAAREVTLTANGSDFTAGAVRVVAHYLDVTAPAS